MSLHFGWTCGANKVVFGPKYHWWKQIQIWILTCWFFLTVDILLGSQWAYHELGWGVGGFGILQKMLLLCLGYWLQLVFIVILPKLDYWILFLNMVTSLCCVLGIFFVCYGLLASIHSFCYRFYMRNLFMVFFPSNYQHIFNYFSPNKVAIEYQASWCIIQFIIKLKLNDLKTYKPNFVAFAKHFICAHMQIHSFTKVDGGQRMP